MKHKKLKLFSVILLCLGLTGLQAQEVIPASGGNASGSGGTMSYTVGQLVYITVTGSNGSVVQGVQQSYPSPDFIYQPKGIILSCTAYPNPIMNFLTLKVENYDVRKLSYQLFDVNGNLLETKKLTGTETIISMTNLVSATYYLTIHDNNKELKSIKLIKN